MDRGIARVMDRHLEAKRDLHCVRHWAQELYAERGRPSIGPVIFFKLQLVMFFKGIRSERQLIETAGVSRRAIRGSTAAYGPATRERRDALIHRS